MARIPGVEPKEAGLFTRIAYFMTKRRLGRVIMPIKIKAHHPRLLRALAMGLDLDPNRSIIPAGCMTASERRTNEPVGGKALFSERVR